MPSVAIVGAGRAGTAFAEALRSVGWNVAGPTVRGDDLAAATKDADIILLCVADGAIAEVAASLPEEVSGVVAHVAGSIGVEVLPERFRRAAIHPLISIPPNSGPELLAGSAATFAVEGDASVFEIVTALGGRIVEVDSRQRALYHAAACIASNHLVALLGQVERVARAAGLDLDAYMPLVNQTVGNVAKMGPQTALTGPAARGDAATIERHLAALDPSEQETYAALAAEASRLAGQGR